MQQFLLIAILNMLFIESPSIFKDKFIIWPISTYFENKESPIICYKYNTPIRCTVVIYLTIYIVILCSALFL